MTSDLKRAFLIGYAYACGIAYGRKFRLAKDDAEFEAKHARGEGGKFTSGSAGSASTQKATAQKVSLLPDSSGINTEREAKEYFEKNLKGVHKLTIHRKAGNFEVDVDMRQNEDHAYTVDPLKAETKGKQHGKRVFDVARARLMGNIFNVISYPSRIYQDHNNDLFLSRQDKDGVQIVVLEWQRGKYHFRSSHKWTNEHLDGKRPYIRGAPVRGKRRG